jgi:hypothetical protein
MSSQAPPTSEPESTFVCDCQEWMRSACAGEPFYKEYEGKRYCVLHFPGKEKSADFEKALQRKLENKDFTFHGVWFPDELLFSEFGFSAAADFRSATFSAAVDFRSATFSAVADFRSATFSAAADFSRATFSAAAGFTSATFSAAADFSRATFSAAAGFSHATFSAAAGFRSATFAAANFSVATFSAAADFSRATFSAAASFGFATFSAAADFSFATFAKACFISATFSAAAGFSDATFSAEADFRFATFSAAASFIFATFSAAADFRSATFSAAADFAGATFSAAANFAVATFSAAANFSFATFADHVRFAGAENQSVIGKTSSLDLQFARIEKPDHVSFHTISLRPHWFVNVDPRKFDFTNVDWDRRSIDEEVERLRGKSVSPAHRLLSIACWHLAVNAEENHRYEEASRFRYMAMDARRLQLRERMRGNLFKAHWRVLKKTLARLHWSLTRDWGVRGRTLTRSKRFIRVYGKTLNLLYGLYWMVSGYGERITRASAVLVGIWFISALLYTFVDFRSSEPKLASEADVASAKRDEIGAPLKFSRALVYSAGVMTLQKPEPRPATTAAQTVVLLETVLGPVQAALLALAIRRKFMR